MRKQCLLHEALTDTTYGAADLSEFKTVDFNYFIFSLFFSYLLLSSLLFLSLGT